MRTVVLYHANCWDGLMSAWLIKTYLHEDAEALGVDYGTPIPYDLYEKSTRVYIVDFSYDGQDMAALAQECNHLWVFDHHKTAESNIDKIRGMASVLFDLHKSGARITMDYLKSLSTRIPPNVEILVGYIEDRDLWMWMMPSSREIVAWIRSYDVSQLSSINAILESNWNEAHRYGESIRRQVNQMRDLMINRGLRIEKNFGGMRDIPCVNTTTLNSEIGEELCRRFPDAPFSVTWGIRADGKIEYHLRSRGEFDVGKFAKERGGGGHKSAAGFLDDPLHPVTNPISSCREGGITF